MALTDPLDTWRCPGCGELVALPGDCGDATRDADDRRLDRLARALCGCWVVDLSEGGLTRLLEAIREEGGAQTARSRAASA